MSFTVNDMLQRQEEFKSLLEIFLKAAKSRRKGKGVTMNVQMQDKRRAIYGGYDRRYSQICELEQSLDEQYLGAVQLQGSLRKKAFYEISKTRGRLRTLNREMEGVRGKKREFEGKANRRRRCRCNRARRDVARNSREALAQIETFYTRRDDSPFDSLDGWFV